MLTFDPGLRNRFGRSDGPLTTQFCRSDIGLTTSMADVHPYFGEKVDWAAASSGEGVAARLARV